jgi:hypothetical protein
VQIVHAQRKGQQDQRNDGQPFTLRNLVRHNILP